jgi:hypothetical protein
VSIDAVETAIYRADPSAYRINGPVVPCRGCDTPVYWEYRASGASLLEYDDDLDVRRYHSCRGGERTSKIASACQCFCGRRISIIDGRQFDAATGHIHDCRRVETPDRTITRLTAERDELALQLRIALDERQRAEARVAVVEGRLDVVSRSAEIRLPPDNRATQAIRGGIQL